MTRALARASLLLIAVGIAPLVHARTALALAPGDPAPEIGGHTPAGTWAQPGEAPAPQVTTTIVANMAFASLIGCTLLERAALRVYV